MNYLDFDQIEREFQRKRNQRLQVCNRAYDIIDRRDRVITGNEIHCTARPRPMTKMDKFLKERNETLMTLGGLQASWGDVLGGAECDSYTLKPGYMKPSKIQEVINATKGKQNPATIRDVPILKDDITNLLIELGRDGSVEEFLRKI